MSTKLQSTNPARGYEVIGEVDVSTPDEVRQKVSLAHQVKQSWKETPLTDRISHFDKLLEIYKKRSAEISKMQSREMGKPIRQSQADDAGNLEYIKHNLQIAREYLKPEIVDESDSQKNIVYYEPYGVAAVITPWNFPSANFFIGCTQLLLAGNVVVLKHSEECPLTGKLLEEMMIEAGFPKGVFSEVFGDGEVGQLIVNEDVDLIHFTGSSKVGQQLYRKAAEKFIPAILEMGGSSPGIIFPDADLELISPNVCVERYENCGQICCALKRLIVHEDIYDSVVARIKDYLENQFVGDPLDEKTDIGPLVAKRQLDLLIEQVEDAKNKGVDVVTGGDVVRELDGAYFQPTLITNVDKNMRVWKEEVFGPVLPVMPFKTEEEAIELANDTEYGLSAFVYGLDNEQLQRVASRIETGQISINGASYFSDNSPFGGYKKSGLGRGGGKFGFYEVTQKKTIALPIT
jgi:acyl-CoA reductase-like NAD-dependent aldehyde dehydrogenase